jgi:hypothetical protein
MENFAFSCANIKNLVMVPDGSFSITYNGNAICTTSKITASFISEKANQIIKNEKKEHMKVTRALDENIIAKVIKAADGEIVAFSHEEMQKLFILAKEISSNELLDFACRFVEVNDENIYDMLARGSEKAFAYAAANFASLDPTKLAGLKTEVISQIINNKEMNRCSGDDLFAFLYELHKKTPNYDLFSLINVNELSDSCFAFFLKEIGLSHISMTIYNEITDRMMNYLPEPKIPLMAKGSEEAPLFKECDGGVIQELIAQNVSVIAISSSYAHKNMKIENIFTPNTYEYFNSADSPDQFITIDFGTVVRVDSYDIQCSKDWECTPMNWNIELSCDGDKFTVIDTRKNTDVREQHGRFDVSGKHYGRYLKIVQTGPNSHDRNNLIIGSFEVYGGYKPLNK